MKYLAFISIALFHFYGLAQSQLGVGEVYNSIKIEDGSDESYALYLPSEYDDSKLSSIVFVFDPSGNGPNGLKTFIKSSERFNHILVCSNNAKNGPYDKNFNIANRLFNSVLDKYNIDPKQIYVAGFSGGSRFSTAIAVLTGQMRAVIACGAGFPDVLSFAPTTPDFIYAGIVGNRDMNFQEMINNDYYLQKLGFTNELFLFNGNHRWPPASEIEKVFAWLEVLSYKDGLSNSTRSDMESIYAEFISDYEHEATILNKVRLLERIISTFNNELKNEEHSKILNNLKNSQQYKSESSELQIVFNLENEFIDRIISRFHKDYKKPNKLNKKWWQKEISKLRKIGKKSDAHAMMIERFLYKLSELAYTRGNPEYFSSSKEQQAFCKFVLDELYTPRKKDI